MSGVVAELSAGRSWCCCSHLWRWASDLRHRCDASWRTILEDGRYRNGVLVSQEWFGSATLRQGCRCFSTGRWGPRAELRVALQAEVTLVASCPSRISWTPWSLDDQAPRRGRSPTPYQAPGSPMAEKKLLMMFSKVMPSSSFSLSGSPTLIPQASSPD